MKHIVHRLTQSIRLAWQRLRPASRPTAAAEEAVPSAESLLTAAPDSPVMTRAWRRWAAPVAVVTLGVVIALSVWRHPPVYVVAPGDIAVRTHRYTGAVTVWTEGAGLNVAGLHEVRRYPLRDQTWRAASLARADGPAPAQTVEGSSIGLELNVRWAVDPVRLRSPGGRTLPADIEAELLEPALQGIVYRVLSAHTVREIFSTQRATIQQRIEQELRQRLADDGIVLKAVSIGNVDLPPDYRKGMDSLLAEGLATEKMRYTLELKERQVKETALEAEADKVRRETAAEAAAREQVIAARAQEEAMKHILPFKQRLVEQRQLEAEAERQARVRQAEGSAQARRIEAQGEADARQKLAEAEAFRLARIGQVNAEQMAAEGVLLTRHPLLIQKTMADRLSDKVQVIIAPAPTSGAFIGEALVGATKARGGQAEPGTAEEAAQ